MRNVNRPTRNARFPRGTLVKRRTTSGKQHDMNGYVPELGICMIFATLLCLIVRDMMTTTTATGWIDMGSFNTWLNVQFMMLLAIPLTCLLYFALSRK